MNLVVFGATGMIGRGVLLEALDSPEVTSVLTVGRHAAEPEHTKHRHVVHDDFESFEPIAEHLTGLNACFWCLGTSSAGMSEASYRRVTYTFTVAAATVLLRQNPEIAFCFVSGAGTDSSGRAGPMWARVKGDTENALREMNFRQLTLVRPAFVQPVRGCWPRGSAYRILNALLLPVYPLLRGLGAATSTVAIGRAMLVAIRSPGQRLLVSRDINRMAATLPTAPHDPR